MMARLPVVSRPLQEDRPTYSSQIAKPSTYPAAIWLSAGTGWRPSMDLIRSSVKPATTWIFAGEPANREGGSDLARQLWSGITIAGRCGHTGNSRLDTGRPRRCSRGNHRKNTIPAATRHGPDAYTSTE